MKSVIADTAKFVSDVFPLVNSKIIRMRPISNWIFSIDEPLAAFSVHFGGHYFFLTYVLSAKTRLQN